MHSASTGATPHPCNLFDVAMFVRMDKKEIHIPSMVLPVMEMDCSSFPFKALLGRDVLSKGMLIYNGLLQSVTLYF